MTSPSENASLFGRAMDSVSQQIEVLKDLNLESPDLDHARARAAIEEWLSAADGLTRALRIIVDDMSEAPLQLSRS